MTAIIATKEDKPSVESGHLRMTMRNGVGESINNEWENRDHSCNHGDSIPLW